MNKTTYMPFLSEFSGRLLSGRKTVTTRTQPYGEAGDFFIAFGEKYRLIQVFPTTLNVVCILGYYSEGLDSPGAFVGVWNRLHPEAGYKPDLMVWVHFFERVATDTKE